MNTANLTSPMHPESLNVTVIGAPAALATTPAPAPVGPAVGGEPPGA